MHLSTHTKEEIKKNVWVLPVYLCRLKMWCVPGKIVLCATHIGALLSPWCLKKISTDTRRVCARPRPQQIYAYLSKGANKDSTIRGFARQLGANGHKTICISPFLSVMFKNLKTQGVGLFSRRCFTLWVVICRATKKNANHKIWTLLIVFLQHILLLVTSQY